jgi:hypothetical protein
MVKNGIEHNLISKNKILKPKVTDYEKDYLSKDLSAYILRIGIHINPVLQKGYNGFP